MNTVTKKRTYFKMLIKLKFLSLINLMLILNIWTVESFSKPYAYRYQQHREILSKQESNTLNSLNYDALENDSQMIPMQLGILPFSVDDIMLVGEFKNLHLYEARFLALFEDAQVNRNGLLAQALIIPQPEGVGFSPVASLLKIEKWDRLDIGVSATVKSIGRVSLTDFDSVDPFLLANVEYLQDQTIKLQQKDALNALSDNIFQLHEQCRKLLIKADKKPLGTESEMNPQLESITPNADMGNFDDQQTLWGHEKSPNGDLSFKTPLPIQVSRSVEALQKEATSSHLLYPMNSDVLAASPELLSFQAAGCLHQHERLLALETTVTLKRLRMVIDSLERYQKWLVAKVAIDDLNIDF